MTSKPNQLPSAPSPAGETAKRAVKEIFPEAYARDTKRGGFDIIDCVDRDRAMSVGYGKTEEAAWIDASSRQRGWCEKHRQAPPCTVCKMESSAVPEPVSPEGGNVIHVPRIPGTVNTPVGPMIPKSAPKAAAAGECRDWSQPHLQALNYLNNCLLDDQEVSIPHLRDILDVPTVAAPIAPAAACVHEGEMVRLLRCKHCHLQMAVYSAPAAVSEATRELENALEMIASDFETDFVLDGKVVDDPSRMHQRAWTIARTTLARAHRCEGGECWHNPETGYLEGCPKHESRGMEQMMEIEAWRGKEIVRWQKAIYDLCRKECGDASIDGGGCDSGDPLDFTLSEISQAFGIMRERTASAEGDGWIAVTERLPIQRDAALDELERQLAEKEAKIAELTELDEACEEQRNWLITEKTAAEASLRAVSEALDDGEQYDDIRLARIRAIVEGK